MTLLDEDAGGGIPEWVVTFGDMMSLLLTFFIMLVSLSEVKSQEKYQALVESMRRQFGYDTTMNALIPGRFKPRNSAVAKLATMGRAMKFNLMKGGNKEQSAAGDHPRVRTIRSGERTAVGTVIYFPEDGVRLSEEHRRDLQRMALEMSGKPQIIEIRGHTSLRPAQQFTSYADNWDLAYRRARNTLDFLVNDLGIDSRRIRISVAGSNEPLHVGTDAEQLRKNARVEVYLTDETVDDRSGTEDEPRPTVLEGSAR